MARKSSILLIAASALLIGTSAHAAEPVYKGSPGYTSVEYGSGWYLRGDLGLPLSADVELTTFLAAHTAPTGYSNQSSDLGYSISGGVGYTFNDMLRSDVTFDSWDQGDWSGRTGYACGGAFTGSCYNVEDAQFSALGVSLNGYLSLGRWHGISPYVGAGIGLAHVEWSGYSGQARCDLDPGEDCALGAHSGTTAGVETISGATTNYQSSSATVLTYSLMFGADYRINENWITDFNYRMTHVGGGDVALASDNAGLTGNTEFDGFTIHEIRAGLRYEIW